MYRAIIGTKVDYSILRNAKDKFKVSTWIDKHHKSLDKNMGVFEKELYICNANLNL